MSKIPYDLGQIRAFVFDVDGVLSPSVVPTAEDGRPRRMANVKDGFALKQALTAGYKIAIITGADTPDVANRMAIIGIKDVFMAAGNKLALLKEWMQNNGLNPGEVAYAGDDVPDIECMRYVGLSVAPADADAEVCELAVYVSTRDGGHGVARELIQETMLAQGLWPASTKAYGL